MKTRFFSTVILIILLNAVNSFACTSVIVSAKVTANRCPIMIKNRDTGEMNNRIEYFKGPVYSFIGLVNSPYNGKGEVWSGTNSAGFSIMNTASYNIKEEDGVSYLEMDKEGEVMYKALGVCRNLADFEYFLDTLSKPYLVESNFGVIDAEGGAAYYEVNNYKWIKFDVNEEKEGYRVVTNFSESGRPEDYQGWERYLTASDFMKNLPKNREGKYDINHSTLFNGLSRSYSHKLLGIENLKNVKYAVDQDFIPRKSTSASIVIEGVQPGEDPKYTVMWTILGYPACSVAIPIMTWDCDIIPYYMKKSADSNNSLLCDKALQIKNNYVFDLKISNGNRYLNAENVYKLIECSEKAEKAINSDFNILLCRLREGRVKEEDFKESYYKATDSYFRKYLSAFASYLKND